MYKDLLLARHAPRARMIASPDDFGVSASDATEVTAVLTPLPR